MHTVGLPVGNRLTCFIVRILFSTVLVVQTARRATKPAAAAEQNMKGMGIH